MPLLIISKYDLFLQVVMTFCLWIWEKKNAKQQKRLVYKGLDSSSHETGASRGEAVDERTPLIVSA